MDAGLANKSSRALLLVLIGATVFFALAVAAVGIVNIVQQLTTGKASLILRHEPVGDYSFVSVGANGSKIPGHVDTVSVVVDGLSGGALLLETGSDLLAALTLVALALSAVALANAILHGRPFSPAATRGVSIAAIAVLIVAVASELIRWLARVVILNELESTDFSRDFSFDPLVITVGLGLAVVATAFRYGERLQRDTEGLV